MIKRKKNIGITLILITTLLLSACTVDIQGEVTQGNDSGTVDLNIGVENGSGNQQDSQDGSSSQQNDQVAIQSEGLLILIGLGVLVMIGLLFGLMRNKSSQE